MNLEHLKLLTVRGTRLERGPGGKPDITFHEVADMLSKTSNECDAYARFNYADAENMRNTLIMGVMLRLIRDDRTEPSSGVVAWRSIVDMAIKAFCNNDLLSKKEKAKRIGKRNWTKESELHYNLAIQVLDDLDYELRLAIADWNAKVDAHGIVL